MGALSGLEAYGSLAKAGVASGIVAVAAISIGAWWGGFFGSYPEQCHNVTNEDLTPVIS